jgi:hypothetical protein
LYDDNDLFPLTLTTSSSVNVSMAAGSQMTMLSSSATTTTMSSSGYALGGRPALCAGSGGRLDIGLVDGDLNDLAAELGGGFHVDERGEGGPADFGMDLDETEPVQSISLTSTLPLSR